MRLEFWFEIAHCNLFSKDAHVSDTTQIVVAVMASALARFGLALSVTTNLSKFVIRSIYFVHLEAAAAVKGASMLVLYAQLTDTRYFPSLL